MRKFSTDAAGFAALTISELMLQQCVLSGLFTVEEAERLLKTAAQRHEEAAEGSETKIALNMEAAHLIRTLAAGLAPLFREQREAARTAPSQNPSGNPKATWIRFPD